MRSWRSAARKVSVRQRPCLHAGPHRRDLGQDQHDAHAWSRATRRAGFVLEEWSGPTALPPRTAQRVSEGLRERGAHRHALQDRNHPHEVTGLAPVELVGLNRVAP